MLDASEMNGYLYAALQECVPAGAEVVKVIPGHPGTMPTAYLRRPGAGPAEPWCHLYAQWNYLAVCCPREHRGPHDHNEMVTVERYPYERPDFFDLVRSEIARVLGQT